MEHDPFKDRTEGETLELASELSSVDEVTGIVRTQLSALGWPEEEINDFELAAHEAVINAVLHGNHEDKDKKVTVTFRFGGREAMLAVADQGEGFAVKDVPDPTSDENVLGTSGRGLFLMGQLCDNVQFSDGGRKVTLVKKRAAT